MAKDFVAGLENLRKELCLKTLVFDSGERMLRVEHMEPSQFACDPDVATVRFTSVPLEMSAHDIVRAASQQTGLVAAACPRPPRGSSEREVLTHIASRNAATFAVAALRGLEFEGRPVFRDAKDVEIVVVPAITADSVDLSAIVIRKLDSLLGVPGDVTNALLDRTCESREAQFELQVTCLRRVQCEDHPAQPFDETSAWRSSAKVARTDIC